jgi:TonB-linked SusC/RagA family outer membrane protein
MVEGTTLGTVTNIDGQFHIAGVPASATTLKVSYIGMTEQTVAIKEGTINIVMKADTEMLDEVLVVAYGTSKKGSLTGAISTVGNKTIDKSLSTSVTGALEGSAPGIQVNNTYGEPGTDPLIRIRGFGSVNGSNAPLYVVDGAPYEGKIADLNAADIESMNILKDAASAALYGNRAANGVVLITTKKGATASKPSVTLTMRQGGYTRGMKEYDRLAADPWMEAQWKALRNSMMSNPDKHYDEATASQYAVDHLIGEAIRRNIYDATDGQLFDLSGKLLAHRLPGYTDLDWADALERTGYRQEYGMSFESGSDKYSVYASVGYLNEKGYIINTGFDRLSGRVNTSFTPTSWFKGGLNLSATNQTQNYNSSANGSWAANPFSASRYTAPVYPIYLHNADGSYQLDEAGDRIFDTTSIYLGNRHIVYERLNDYERNHRLTASASAFVTFVLPYGFDVTVKGTEDYMARRYIQYENPEIGDGASSDGRLSNYDYRTTTTNFQQLINWSHDYGRHHVDALLGHESYQYKYSLVNGMNTSMSIAGNMTMGNFTTNSSYSGYDDEDTQESYLARGRYNYAEKYFFEASFRRDGSSRFAKNNRWGSFFSVGGAWDISKENFIKEAEWIDFLKLRASYGETGNNYVSVAGSEDVNYYANQALYFLDKNGGVGSLIRLSLAANDLKWETSQTIDLALEGHLWNRLDFSVGYFNRASKDLLFAVPLPASAGSYVWGDNINLTIMKNIGSVRNAGAEISAAVDIIKGRDWKWNFGLDATFLDNKITKLPDHKDIANGTYRRYSEGHSIYEFYTYHFEGIDQLTGRSLYTLDPERAGDAATADMLININGTDYTLDANYGKRDFRGTAVPTVYGSVHTGLTWRDLTLNVLMTYSLGGKVFDSGYQSLMSTNTSTSLKALHTDMLNSWTEAPDGITETSPNRIDPKGTPLIDYTLSAYNNATSDRWLTSADYLVMKNITLSYQLPKTLVQSWGLQSILLNAAIENAFTVTARQGLNPQYGFTGTQDATYTTARIFNFGLTLKF